MNCSTPFSVEFTRFEDKAEKEKKFSHSLCTIPHFCTNPTIYACLVSNYALNIFSSKFHWDLFSISVNHVILVFDFGITRIFLSSMKTIFSSWMEGLWSLADAFSRLHSFSRWLRLWHRSVFGSRISLFSPRGSVFVSRWVSSSRHVDLQLQKPEKYYQYQCHEYKV